MPIRKTVSWVNWYQVPAYGRLVIFELDIQGLVHGRFLGAEYLSNVDRQGSPECKHRPGEAEKVNSRMIRVHSCFPVVVIGRSVANIPGRHNCMAHLLLALSQPVLKLPVSPMFALQEIDICAKGSLLSFVSSVLAVSASM